MKREPQPPRKALSTAKVSPQPDVTDLPGSYPALIAGIKRRVRHGELRAHLAACREFILLYWWTGRNIVVRQKKVVWGKSRIERLAPDIQKKFPGIEGLLPLNLWPTKGTRFVSNRYEEFTVRIPQDSLCVPMAYWSNRMANSSPA